MLDFIGEGLFLRGIGGRRRGGPVPANYVSAASGAWNDPATWGGAGVPTDIDTATITGRHVVTVPVGVSASCGALTLLAGISSAKTKLVVAGTYDMAGNIALAASTGIDMSAGAALDFNGFSITRSGIAYLTFMGSAGSRCTVTSTGARGTIPDAALPLVATMAYVDFSGLGACEWGRSHTSALFQTYDYCTWTDCGIQGLENTSTNAGAGFRVSRCDFRSPASPTAGRYPRLYTQGAAGPQRLMEHCTFASETGELMPTFQTYGLVASENVFDGCSIEVVSNFPVNFTGNLFAATLFKSDVCNIALAQDNYFYSRGLSLHSTGYNNTQTFDFIGNVTEGIYGGDSSGTNFALGTAPWTGTVNIRDNLSIGEAGTLVTFTAAGAAGTLNVNNNTMCVDNLDRGPVYPTLFMTEGAGNITGGTVSVYDNLVVDPDSTTPMDRAVYLTQATAGQIDTLQNNCGWAYPAGEQSPPLRYENCTPTGSDISVDPMFVDRTRKLATWDGSLGGAGTAESAIDIFRAKNSNGTTRTVADLVDWVKAGFAPTNAVLATAGMTGGRIGAIDVA